MSLSDPRMRPDLGKCQQNPNRHRVPNTCQIQGSWKFLGSLGLWPSYSTLPQAAPMLNPNGSLLLPGISCFFRFLKGEPGGPNSEWDWHPFPHQA